MTDGGRDDSATRDALRRLAGIAADTARPPDLADLQRRTRRRRARTAGAVGMVTAAVLAVPIGIGALSPAGQRGQAVTGPAVGPTTTTSVAPTARPSDGQEPLQPTVEPSTGTRRVKLFLLRERAGQPCPQIVPVTRELPTEGVAKRALAALLDGPTPAEQSAGLTSVFRDDAYRFRYLKLDGPTARADFTDLDGVLAPDDRCEKIKLLEPMRRTLEQFGWIREARFSIRGDQRAFYVDVLHDQVPK
ncbi:GerMN domain-containing protein [Micromonospora sp. WMMD754]|uniref:GerMN domain-containing protein n=1 Tax=Micromonospora sp. WMMD754 TaxID=3404114 RepID=UPI003BF5F928